MIRVEKDCHASADRLWSVVADLDRWAELLPTVDEIVAVDGTTGPGPTSRYAIKQPRLPEAVYTVTDWRPGRGFTWHADARGVRTTARHEVVQRPEGSRLVLELEWSGAGAGLARLLFGGRTRRMVTQEAASFVAHAEAATAR